MAQTFIKTLVVLPIFLVIADIIGALGLTLVDIASLRYASAALAYAVWLVLGVFAGLFAYNAIGAWASPQSEQDWSAGPGGAQTGNVILIASFVILAALTALFHRLYWSQNVAGEYYVPDSMPHSLVFFGAVFAAMLAGRFMLMVKPSPVA